MEGTVPVSHVDIAREVSDESDAQEDLDYRDDSQRPQSFKASGLAAAIQGASARGAGGLIPGHYWGHGGGDAAGHGDGSDAREEGFVEQH